MAAVTSNFSNHLYQLAAEYCNREGIDFSLLFPIIQETALQIQSKHPAMVQAGPAYRGDLDTINQHKSLLEEDEQLLKLYEVFSESIQKTFK